MGACPGVAGAAGVSGTRRGACLLCRLPTLPLRCPRGGVPALPPAYTATAVPAGGACLLCRLLTLPLTCFLAPIPPSPLPGGKGVTIGYFMQGASPLASPGLNPGGTGSPCHCGKLNGGLAPALPAQRASAVPGGGRACFAACLPYLWLDFLPPSPQPPSRREGGDQGYFMQGASPLASPGLNPRGTGYACGKLVLWALLWHRHPPGQREPVL